jgi:hypothetical protein
MSAQPSPVPDDRKGMFCDQCGRFAIRRIDLRDETGSFRCAGCGHAFSRRVLPLRIVTGASGVGKSSVIPHLQRLLTECAVLDKDELWAPDWDLAYTIMLRVASALAQGGRGTVIVGAIVPEHVDQLPSRDLVGPILFANLHCDDATRARRQRQRRFWNPADEEFTETHRNFARWLLDHAESHFDPPMATFDTSTATPEEVAASIARWVRASPSG